MNRLRGIVLSVAVAIGCLAASGPASAEWHGSVGVYVGPGPWWGAPYPYPYPYYDSYPPVVVVDQSPMYTQPIEMPAPPTYWYYCRKSNTYYPYVAECPGGWEQVTPQPPPSSAPGAAPTPR